MAYVILTSAKTHRPTVNIISVVLFLKWTRDSRNLLELKMLINDIVWVAVLLLFNNLDSFPELDSFFSICQFIETINVSFLSILFYFISVSEMNNTEGAIAAFQYVHAGVPRCFIVLDIEKNQREAVQACLSLASAMCRYYDNGHFRSYVDMPVINNADDVLGVS